VWTITGYSIEATRAAMLALAALTLYATFLLGIELARGVPGFPAFFAAALLFCSPIYYTQSMMALLEVPAALFTTLALLFFVQGKLAWSVAACTLLVLSKETGAVAPVIFGVWVGVRERRWKRALWFLIPLAPLASWALLLGASTGRVLGNDVFTSYNLFYPLHPARLFFAFLRRFYYLFVENFHWIGWIAVAAGWRAGMFRSQVWTLTAVFCVAHVCGVTALGGATLERYLLPVLPPMYIAMAMGFEALTRPWRAAARIALPAGLALSLFWNPVFWPFPHENNLAVVDFVDLQRTGAEYVEAVAPRATVMTAWPLSDAMRRPEFGYVSQSFRVEQLPDFNRSTVIAAGSRAPEVFVLYSRMMERPHHLLQVPFIRRLWERYYGYEPQIDGAELHRRFGYRPLGRWVRRGQWIEVYAR
jgi:hypothetical protein